MPVHSHCTQQDVANISDAVSIFSSKNQSGQIPLVLIPAHRNVFSANGWWLSVPTGCSCLMQQFGKDVGLAAPGGSFKPPYYRIAYIVTQQSCTYDAPVKECPTSDNVRVGVDCVLVFMVRNAKDFVYKLGAVRFDQLLSGAVDEGIRLLVRQQTHQKVRTLRGNRADTLLNYLNKKFENVGVVFSNCTITAVHLPDSLEKSLENATILRKAMNRLTVEQEYELSQKQRQSDIALEELTRKNEQAIVMETGKKDKAELQHQQEMVKASEVTQTALIEVKTATEIKRMAVQADFERCKIDMERLRVETLSKAEAEAEAKRVQADIAYEKTTLNAEAQKNRLLAEAEAIKLDAQAEEKATTHLSHKRKHELDIREKEVLKKLAEKANYNLIGEHGDQLVGAMLSGHMDGGGPKRNSWFGESS